MPFQQTNIFLQQKIIKVINMKKILFKLNDFCNANRIEYMVTGDFTFLIFANFITTLF